MFDGALERAFDNMIGRLGNLVPDWLAWIVSLQFEVWAALAIGIAVGFVLGKWGWAALGTLGAALAIVFTLGRNSKK